MGMGHVLQPYPEPYLHLQNLDLFQIRNLDLFQIRNPPFWRDVNGGGGQPMGHGMSCLRPLTVFVTISVLYLSPPQYQPERDEVNALARCHPPLAWPEAVCPSVRCPSVRCGVSSQRRPARRLGYRGPGLGPGNVAPSIILLYLLGHRNSIHNSVEKDTTVFSSTLSLTFNCHFVHLPCPQTAWLPSRLQD